MNEFQDLMQQCHDPDGAFHHSGHVKLAWLLLQRHSPLEAIASYCAGLRQFTVAHNQSQKYNETLTIAFMLLILERLVQHRDPSWEDFATRNPDLLRWGPSAEVMGQYYTLETLNSSAAKQHFVLPDLSA